MSDRFHHILATTRAPRIAVIGDLILDESLRGDVRRISPEAPVPVLDATEVTPALGGAANVARNLAGLGATVTLLGVVGDDAPGRTLRELLETSGIGGAGVFSDPSRPTTVKTRVLARGQHLVRIDREERRPWPKDLSERVLGELHRGGEPPDAIVISDYAKGAATGILMRGVFAFAHGGGIPVLVDPKGREPERYRGATLLTPNQSELAALSGHPADRPEARAVAVGELLRSTGAEAVLVTLGAAGMELWRGTESLAIGAQAREVFDVTGAGDTVIAVMAYGLAAGGDLATGARLANVAAGIVVGKLGTAAVDRRELGLWLTTGRGGPPKVLDREVAASAAAAARARGLRVVFTNGCFDLFHAGHVAFLQAARAQGDYLMVGLNTDASVRRLKGSKRPIVAEGDRAAVVAALDCVSAVTLFDEDTPLALIERVVPDVLVKGADYRLEEVVGREVVEGAGGKVHLVPLVEHLSTSKLIAAILAGGSGTDE